jgi:hypothetical protein
MHGQSGHPQVDKRQSRRFATTGLPELDSAVASTRVPAEHLGQARLFRNQVAAEDRIVDAALSAITKPLVERLRQHPKLRPQQPMGALRQWAETMPTGLCIGRPRVAHHKSDIAISEHRITVSWLQDEAWGEDASKERGVSICKLTFAVHKGKFVKTWRPVACVSLHALARRIERGAERGHAALIGDLAVLAEAPADGDGERVDTPASCGLWLGAVILAQDDGGEACRIRNVRTWLPDLNGRS